MLRRLVTLLLTLTVALTGLAASPCAGAQCGMMRQRMRCCEPGLHAERSCCGRLAPRAAASEPAALERVHHQPAPGALPLAASLSSPLVARGPIAAVPIRLSHAPPPTLIAQHTSLLL
jgi:hypothetical protein